jgi:hypothetical protein
MDEHEHYGPGQPVNAADVAAIIAERDRLREQVHYLMARGADRVDMMNADYGCPDCGVHHACGEVVAERDRLRAVVDAALEVVRPMADSACDADVLRIADLYRILAGPALGSPVICGPPVICRWCHRPIVLLPADKLPIDEPAWAHVEPQPGTNRPNQVQCEPDMQSMKAEPTPVAALDESADMGDNAQTREGRHD